VKKVIELINGKTRHATKIEQINNNILSLSRFNDLKQKLGIVKPNVNPNLDNYWLAGFTDADGNFTIRIINNEKKKEVRLLFKIDQKKEELLVLIFNNFGGYLGYRKSQDTYYYQTVSFGSAKKVINYFDRVPHLSNKLFKVEKGLFNN
jgi:hypothetical protein